MNVSNHLLLATAVKLAGNVEQKETFSGYYKYYSHKFLLHRSSIGWHGTEQQIQQLRAGTFSVHAQCHHSDAARGSVGIKAVRFP